MPPVLAISFGGPGEWLVILAIAILLFGGSKIPELARSLGKAKSEFQKGVEEGEKEIEASSDEGNDEPDEEEPTANGAATA